MCSRAGDFLKSNWRGGNGYRAVRAGAVAGVAAVFDGAAPVVVAGGTAVVVAVCGPLPPVPAHHQIPSPMSTTTMMPMIQLPPALPVAVQIHRLAFCSNPFCAAA